MGGFGGERGVGEIRLSNSNLENIFLKTEAMTFFPK